MTVIEAMAQARPVIVPNITALPEMVVEGKTGYLFKKGSHEDLAIKLKSLAGNLKLIKQRGAEGRKRAEDLFDLPVNARHLKVFTGAFNLSALLLIVFAMGTLFSLPPLSWVIDISESIKDASIEVYGEPPYGHAELSTLETFTPRVGLDQDRAVDRLQDAGIEIEDMEQSLGAIAESNKITASELYLIMKPEKATGNDMLPETPGPGFSKLTLMDICQKYHLDVSGVFVAIGFKPNTSYLQGILDLDEKCSVVVDAGGMMETSLPGVFAAGDVRHGVIRRVASAVGQGSAAINFVHEYLKTV